MTRESTLIFGPAYLDRVLRVDRPLISPIVGIPTIDGSTDGTWREDGVGLTLVDPIGHQIEIELPHDWPGPTGKLGLSRNLGPLPRWLRTVRGISWVDDLGGMGAGFAAAFGAPLVSALGVENDPTSRAISALLSKAGILHQPIRVAGKPTDWTLLITSGEHGDKLAVGFRGCHASLPDLGDWVRRECQLRVVAALPNRLASLALAGPATVRVFAPSSRNMLDRDWPIQEFAPSIDILCCNRGEWESLDDHEALASSFSVLSVTDGARGATLRFHTAEGTLATVEVPAFPRARPPRDTNRAGEAFASTLIQALMEAGWTPAPVSTDLIRRSAQRASVAAALVLDRLDFGFPTALEIDQAIRVGRVT